MHETSSVPAGLLYRHAWPGRDDYALACRCARCGARVVLAAPGSAHSPTGARVRLRRLGWTITARGWTCARCAGAGRGV